MNNLYDTLLRLPSPHERSKALFASWFGKTSALVLAAFLLVSLLGCTAQFVSTYDETTDTMAKEAQSKIDHQFQTWIRLPAGSPALRYGNKANLAFYSDAFADLSVLASRVKAQPLNKDTAGMVAQITDSLATVEALHKTQNTISAAALRSAQQEIDFQFQRLMSFELAKKRGDDSPKK